VAFERTEQCSELLILESQLPEVMLLIFCA
jgi:hypothetical protein